MAANAYKVMTFSHLPILKDDPKLFNAFLPGLDLSNTSCGMKFLWNWLEQSLTGRF